MIERQEKGIPGLPNVRTGFALDFLRRMEERMVGQKVPTWRGELYLEYHRGTYTSIAKNKRNNRKSELLYQNAESLAVTDRILFGTPYPKADFRRGWEMILTNQFHDIIPGSSIKAVYDQSDIDYAVIRGIGEGIASGAKTRIAESIDKKHGYVVFNPHSFIADGTACVNGKTALVSGIPAKGFATVAAPVTENRIRIEGKTVETDLFRVIFDDAMQLVSVYDKEACREVLAEGAVGNEIRIYPDHPDKYDNWEWQEYSLDCYTALTALSDVQIVDDGARRGIRITRPYKNSTVTQTIWFYDSLRRIDFDTVADWHEHHLMLKAAFPVDVNSDKASYEIQFGTVERPTHKNTSWDSARFEVCAHKYADLSEGGYGVALLNDCKYGYDIHDGTMQLSLLKCGTDPNPEADQGEHRFTYSLYPHTGTLVQSDVAHAAYLLNDPLTAIPACGDADRIPTSFSLLSVESDHVMCETVKEAEEGDDVVLRVYEYKNMKDTVEITLGFDVERAELCDMLEGNGCEVAVSGRTLRLPISGFEILTLRLTPAKK
jgi:alpha-mannosidase